MSPDVPCQNGTCVAIPACAVSPGPGKASRNTAVAWRKCPAVLVEELLPAAAYVTERYANNSVKADHSRLTAR
jgi:hypothetical protein